MIEAGINVALGTDSVICLDTPDRISVLDEMRLLHRRDGTDPQLLLRMATVNGAMALGINPRFVSLRPGTTLGLMAMDIPSGTQRDALGGVLFDDRSPRWVHGPLPVQ
jgi:aminodeoxyfutalosine deaminase